MCSSAALFLQQPSSLSKRSHLLSIRKQPTKKINRSLVPVARLFGPAIFESSKLKVLFVGGDDDQAKINPGKLPRTYTLTHSDITSKLTLAISNTINRAQLQGWYNKLQRDEVVAEWMKLKGKMSLHVHCHISGGHFLLDLIAKLRYYIFCKELPVVLKAFVHGDRSLFKTYPELEEALVYVYFHSSIPEFNKVQCWGRLRDAVYADHKVYDISATCNNDTCSDSSVEYEWEWPQRCQVECDCCFPPQSLIPWPSSDDLNNAGENQLSARQLQ